MRIYVTCSALEQPVGVVRASIDEAINRVTIIDLVLVTRAEFKTPEIDALIGQPITLFIEDTINGAFHKSRFDGMIFEMVDVANGRETGGVYYYTLVMRPRLWRLNYYVHARAYVDKSRIQVVDELLKEHQMAIDEHYTKNYKSEKVYPPYYQILQTGNSDLSFYHHTLANAGISYYFGADDDADREEQLHLFDDNVFLGQFDEVIPIVSDHGMVKDQRCVAQITRLTRAIPQAVNATASLADGSVRHWDSAETNDQAGTAGEVHVYVPEGGEDPETVARHAGRLTSQRLVTQRFNHRGTADHIRIRPGKRVSLKDFGTLDEYRVLVTGVQHRFEQTPLAALSDSGGGTPRYKN